MMSLQLHTTIQEARETYKVPRHVAERRWGLGNRVLENYEYGKAKFPLETIRNAAEDLRCPEILDQAYADFPQEWPRVPLPQRIEDSLLANAAKAVKEAQGKAKAMEAVTWEIYGKSSAEDLSQKDRQLIEEAIKEGAEAVRVFKKFCIVLVKQYGFSMKEIDQLIARRLG